YWVSALSEGRVCARVVEAHAYALRGHFHPDDQIVVISHRGTKRFPREVHARAQQAGARTLAVSGDGAADPGGSVVLRTCADEKASAHTVSYLSALAVLGRLVAKMLDTPAASRFNAALDAVPEAIAATLAQPAPMAVLPRLVNKEPLFLTGFGIDEITAREAALKLKEGAYLWAEGLSEEFALHGTPAVFEPRHAALVIVPDVDDGGRSAALRSLLATLHVETLTVGAGAFELRFAPVDELLRPFVAIVPLQRLVAELARRRGSNPDTTRADVEPYKSAIDSVRL
ncbi:MAG TPA: hypothetical protein VF292_05320, partial [Rhodanobacteraceae bacterium]